MSAGTIQRSSAGGRSRRSRAKPMAEINVTPMVDVMLVLLIIFMVAAPLLTVGVPIELPETAAQPLPQEDEQPLTITLASDGSITLQNDPIERDGLVSKLLAIRDERASDKIFLRADGSVSYEEVMVVMGALNNGGFRNIGFVTDAGGPTLTDQDG